ncbi:MAG TPA: hypothetical protein VF160_16440 [Candidatus Dormibacteraeota bacterium]
MDYLHILTRALAITWRHKYLWLLAIFAGEATTIGFGFHQGSAGTTRSGRGVPTHADWAQVTAWMGAHAALLWSLGILVALVGLALFLVSAVANGALVRGAAEHDAERHFGLRQAWRAGLGTFRPVLGIKLFGLLVFASGAIVIGGLGLMTAVFGYGGNLAAAIATGALAGLLLLAAIPIAIVLQVAIVLGVRAVVLDGRGASAGLAAGLSLIRHRLGRVALFLLLVSLAGVLASLVVGLAVAAAALPVVVLAVSAYLAGGWALAVGTGLVLGAAWLVVAVACLGAANAFTSTCWTLAYPRFDQEPSPAVSAAAGPAPA